jgi:hypothetical protein
MRNKILILCLAVCLISIVYSQPIFSSDIHSKAGTTGFGFLKIGAGARAIGMGSAFAGVSGDIHCSYWNPAGLAWIDSRQVTATYLNYLLDIQSGYIGYAQPYKNLGVFGITIQYMNFGDFDKTEINQSTGRMEYQGTFGASDVAIGLSYGRALTENMSLGATFYPLIRESIDNYSATAMAFHLGLQHHFPVEGGLTVGAALQNAGATLSGFTDDYKDDLPFNIKLGGGLKLAHLPLLLAFDINKAIDQNIRFNLGGELKPNDLLHFRLGYRFNTSDLRVGTSKDDYVGIGGGFGLTLRSYAVDYALSSFGELGLVHRVTISSTL